MTANEADRAVHVEEGAGYYCARFEAMASSCEILCETTDRAEAAELGKIAAAETRRIDQKFSRYINGNAVARINEANGQPVEVDQETSELIDFAKKLHELSGGLFDISSGVLRQAWTFDGSDNVPSAATVSALLTRVGWHRAHWNRPWLRLPPGMEIDLGGIGKEYAVDRSAALLRERSPVSCLVNLGGDLAVSRPPQTMPHWRVGIEAIGTPANLPAKLLKLQAGGLATSGDAQRYLQKDGQRYSHILDPRSGWPVEQAPRAVTVAADTCTQAGMLATLAMLRGEGAEAFLAAQNVDFWCLR